MTATAKTSDSSRPMPTAPSTLERWFPIAVWLPKYKWGQYLTADLIAAISVAALLIPESMGYATVAGLPVQIGLYLAPLALIGYAMFGGSKVMVFAAAGSVAAITASILGALAGGDQATAMVMASALALTTGAIFIVAGLLRMGWISNFMSNSVMAGFIFGMSWQIIIGQLGKMVGVSVDGDSSFEKLWTWISQIGDWNLTAVVIGVGSLILIFAIQRYLSKMPAALTAVVVASAAVAFLSPDVDLVAQIPRGMPSFGIPSGLAASDWLTLLAAGVIVALIAFSEGWGASAKVSETTHDQLNSNQEFIAYGVGNIGAGLLGGMGATGSLSKSSAALASGAKSQMSNIFLAIFVLLTLVFLAPLFQWLPEAVLAAIVINAMSESAIPKKLIKLWHIDKVDFWLAALTALVVLVADLLPAMIFGIVFSVFYMVYRISFPGRAELGQYPDTGDFAAINWEYGRRHGTAHDHAKEVPGVLVYRLAAPLIFTNAEAFQASGRELLIKAGKTGVLPNSLVIDCEEILFVDDTGAGALTGLHGYAKQYGVDIKLARLHSGTHKLLQLAGVMEEIGEDNVYDTIRNAVAAAEAMPAPGAQANTQAVAEK